MGYAPSLGNAETDGVLPIKNTELDHFNFLSNAGIKEGIIMVESVYILSNTERIQKVLFDERMHYLHMRLAQGEGLPEHRANSTPPNLPCPLRGQGRRPTESGIIPP